jgi:integrase
MAVIAQRDSGRWQAKIRRKGWPAQSKTFRTRADAEAWARALEREMDIGAFISRDDAERTTFKDAADRYARDLLPAKRGKAQDEYVLKRVVENFGAYSLASISPALVSDYRDKRLKAVSGQTVMHELGMMSRIFQAAALDWRIPLPRGNPIAMVRKPAVAGERSRRLEAGEEELLLAALSECEAPWPRAAVVLAIETAARQSELLALRWHEVDLKQRVARLRGKDGGATKSGDPYRDVPLSSRAVAVLKSLPRSSGGLVFPLSQNALQLAWERACARARKAHLHARLRTKLSTVGLDQEAQAREIRALVYKKRTPLEVTSKYIVQLNREDRTLVDLHFHDLRHEATSRLADKLAMHELMKVTGHKTSRMLGRYYHPRAAELALKLA